MPDIEARCRRVHPWALQLNPHVQEAGQLSMVSYGINEDVVQVDLLPSSCRASMLIVWASVCFMLVDIRPRQVPLLGPNGALNEV